MQYTESSIIHIPGECNKISTGWPPDPSNFSLGSAHARLTTWCVTYTCHTIGGGTGGGALLRHPLHEEIVGRSFKVQL